MSLKKTAQLLFGGSGYSPPSLSDVSEHGRVGNVSTGRPFKYVSLVDANSGEQTLIVNDRTDTNNSTTTPLTGGATFTGTATDTLGYSTYSLMVQADQDSAAGGLSVEYSSDGTTWYAGESYTIPADTVKFFTPPLQDRYVRVVYTNGATPQTTFKLDSVLRKGSIKPSSHNLNDNLNDDDDGELTVSVLKLRTAQDTYVSGSATTAGNFKVSLEETNGYEPTQFEGGEVTVGTSAVELTFTDQTKTILIQADHDNTGSIWIGKSNVTSSTNRMARLMAGESVTISLNDTSDPIYAVSDSAGQTVYKMGSTQ